MCFVTFCHFWPSLILVVAYPNGAFTRVHAKWKLSFILKNIIQWWKWLWQNTHNLSMLWRTFWHLDTQLNDIQHNNDQFTINIKSNSANNTHHNGELVMLSVSYTLHHLCCVSLCWLSLGWSSLHLNFDYDIFYQKGLWGSISSGITTCSIYA
jgi:hypothetical protein